MRAVKLGGPLDSRETQAHVRWARAQGFDALFVCASDAGPWWDDGERWPRLTRDFRRLARYVGLLHEREAGVP